jgi:hypothetical protein
MRVAGKLDENKKSRAGDAEKTVADLLEAGANR